LRVARIGEIRKKKSVQKLCEGKYVRGPEKLEDGWSRL
jgi:hypothetical protein